MINRKLIYISIIFFATLFIILTYNPNLDIAFSQLFYHADHGFFYKSHFLSSLIFLSVPLLTKLLVVFCSIHIIYILITKRSFKQLLKTWSIYLIATAIIGPGFIINEALKNNFGRARPSQVTNFNGTKEFTPAGSISDQCDRNCSFASGHAGMAFYFTAIAYLIGNNKAKKRRTNFTIKSKIRGAELVNFSSMYIIMLIFGCIVGMARIVMGGHFLSDVAAAASIVLIVNHLLYICWKKLS